VAELHDSYTMTMLLLLLMMMMVVLRPLLSQ
jgi:hypothetical protein